MSLKRDNYIPSKYKYVKGNQLKGVVRWCSNYKKLGTVYYDTEREAALSVDMYLIRLGKKPVNVLVSVK